MRSVVCRLSSVVLTCGFVAGCRDSHNKAPAQRTGASALEIAADAGTRPDEDEGGRIVNEGPGDVVRPNSPLTKVVGTGGYWTAQKMIPAPAPEAPRLRPKEKVLAQASAAQPDELISVTFILQDEPADWKAFRAANGPTERQAWIQARHSALTATRQALITWLAANGAAGIEPFWITNQVHAFVPAAKVAMATSRADVLDVAPDGRGSDLGTWTGKESTDATRIADLYAAGIVGHAGGRLRPRVEIAIVEQSPIYKPHAAWNKSFGGSRIEFVKDCTSGTTCSGSTADATTDTHGTRVAAIAAASIEAGQDPAYPGTGTLSQRQRSGHVKDSYLTLYLWTQSNLSSAARAIQQAVGDGADVINLSFRAGDGCDRFENAGGINGVLKYLFSTGVVVVASAGNEGNGPGCTLAYPAMRPEVFAVNGLDTFTDQLKLYESFGVLTSASRGGTMIRSYGNYYPGYLSGVDGVTAGKFDRLPSPPGNSYAAGLSGSSAAAPVASALFGEIRNIFHNAGWTKSTGAFMATGLLFGDGWDSDTDTTTTVGMSWRSGAGRLRAHWPSSVDLAAPWGWGWRAVTIYPGQTVTWPVGDGGPISTSVTQWKWSVLWAPWDLDAVPDIDFYVDDTCAGGGVLAYDAGYDVRARFRLAQSQISGRCLQMRAVGYSVPPEGVTFYSADYFHSGATEVH